MAVDIKAQAQAYRKFADWLESAEGIQKCFQQAELPLPEKLQAVIGVNGNAASSALLLRPPAPPEADDSWVWIEVKKAMAGTLALAIVRANPRALTTREIHEQVQSYGVDAVMGTIANTGTRAEEQGIIHRDLEARWILDQPEKTALIDGDHLWGPPSVFQMQELAANRRNAVVHLLTGTGFQIVQIVSLLRSRHLVHPEIPVNKTLIKDDLHAMDGTRVRRRGKIWEAIE